MTKDDKAHSNISPKEHSHTSELSREEIDRLNYERKVRDQESAGRRITPWHINIVAVSFCIIGLLYAIPRMLWINEEEVSNYVPLSERESAEADELLPPLPSERRVFLDDGIVNGTPVAPSATPAITPTNLNNVEPAPEIGSQVITLQQNMEELLPENEIISTIEQWAQQWSNQNVNGYISHYASSFLSQNGQNKQAWQEYRDPRITSPEWIEVNVSELEVEIIDTNNAQADFMQIYNASNYTEESFKRLVLVRESGQWKIHRELSVDI